MLVISGQDITYACPTLRRWTACPGAATAASS